MASIMAPAGTAQALMQITNWTSAPNTYMLYSDLQFEARDLVHALLGDDGSLLSTYPRTDGTALTGGNCINAAKAQPIGSTVTFADRAVTGSFAGFFYIQCPETDHRAHGIKVVSSANPSVGSSVNVTGTLAKDSNDELMINAASVTAGDPVNPPAHCGHKKHGNLRHNPWKCARFRYGGWSQHSGRPSNNLGKGVSLAANSFDDRRRRVGSACKDRRTDWQCDKRLFCRGDRHCQHPEECNISHKRSQDTIGKRCERALGNSSYAADIASDHAAHYVISCVCPNCLRV